MPSAPSDVINFAEAFQRFGPYFLVVLLIAAGMLVLLGKQPEWLDRRKRFWLAVGFYGASAVASVLALWDWGTARQNEVIANARVEARRIVEAAESEANQLRASARQDADRWFVRRILVSLEGADLHVRGVGLPQTASDDYRAVWQIGSIDWRLEVTIFGRFPVTERHVPLVYLELEDPVAGKRTALPLCVAHIVRADRIEIVMRAPGAGAAAPTTPSLRILHAGVELAPETCIRGA